MRGTELSVDVPPQCAVAISKSDTEDLPQPMIVYVNVGGTITVTPAGNADGDSVAFVVAAGGRVPCVCKRVWSNGTSATGITGVY